MFSKELLRVLTLNNYRFFLSPIVNVLVAVFLLSVYFIAGQSVTQTFTVANMASLNNLRPYPIDYLWELNFHQAPVDKNKIRYYADYYEHLLQVFPCLWDAYGVLGYCYHYLNDDAKAIKFLKIAIQNYPAYFWNYYNLAVIYIDESRYQEAADVLQKALAVDPMGSFKKMVTSPMVYMPLLGTNEKEIVINSAEHLRDMYKVSYFLEKILSHVKDKKAVQELIRNLHPELYAF